MVGLCNEEEKLLGPVQLQLVAPVAPPVKVNVLPSQTGFGAANAVTPEGRLDKVIASVCAALAPQLLPAETVMLPEALAKFTSMPVVPCPAVMVAPEGTVQL